MAILAFDQRDESQSKITAFQERNDKDAAAYTAELKVNKLMTDGREQKVFRLKLELAGASTHPGSRREAEGLLVPQIKRQSLRRRLRCWAGQREGQKGGRGWWRDHYLILWRRNTVVLTTFSSSLRPRTWSTRKSTRMPLRRLRRSHHRILTWTKLSQISSRWSHWEEKPSWQELLSSFRSHSGFQVEDQNFALFNYVTEMNNQVEGLQEQIAKLRSDIKLAKGRGDERERQQRLQVLFYRVRVRIFSFYLSVVRVLKQFQRFETRLIIHIMFQLETMERKVNSSVAEADACEAKVELMEGVLVKLKFGTEEVGQSLVSFFIRVAGSKFVQWILRFINVSGVWSKPLGSVCVLPYCSEMVALCGLLQTWHIPPHVAPKVQNNRRACGTIMWVRWACESGPLLNVHSLLIPCIPNWKTLPESCCSRPRCMCVNNWLLRPACDFYESTRSQDLVPWPLGWHRHGWQSRLCQHSALGTRVAHCKVNGLPSRVG